MAEDAPLTVGHFTETMVDVRSAIERMEARLDARLAAHDRQFARLNDRFDDMRIEMDDMRMEMKAGFDRVDGRLIRLERSER